MVDQECWWKSSWLGFVIIGIFIAAWAVSHIVYKAKGIDDVQLASGPRE